MKRTHVVLLAILTAACGGTTEPDAGFGSLTGEWYASKYAPDFGAEWSLRLTELSTGYVAGNFTLLSSGAIPTPVTTVHPGRVAGEHRGADVILTFLYEDGDQVGFEGRQVEANLFWGTLEGWGPLDFVRADPS